MKHYGDITKIHGDSIEPVDVITFGSPCQDLSVAGKRAGLDGARSGLFYESIRIIKEMRDNDIQNGRTDEPARPRWIVFENVPGLLSSNKGEDFRIVLEEICRIKDQTANVPRPKNGKWQPSGCILGDGFSVAWRVSDNQFWGTPQRRRRISLVGDFRGHGAAEILFERKSVSGDSEQSETERENLTAGITGSTGKTISFQERAGKPGGARESLSNTTEQEHCQPLTINESCNHNESTPPQRVYDAQRRHSYKEFKDVSEPVQAQYGTGGNNQPLVIEMTSTKNTVVDSGISPTLTQRMGTGGNQVNAVLQ